MKKSYIVDSTCNEMRLDRWLRLKIGKFPQGLVEKYLRTGKIKINGEIINDYPIYLRTKKYKIGYVPQYGGFFEDLSLFNNLKAIAEIVIDNKNLMKNKIDYMITKFELENVKDIKAKYLSGGQKKKLVIALA